MSRPKILYQSHRGGLLERPENTMEAFRYSWGIDGAIPELDVRTTADDVLVCMHDETPGRTTDAPPELAERRIREIELKVLATLDAGVKFDPLFAGERVPLLSGVFSEMNANKNARLYLEVKNADLQALSKMITAYNVESRIIFVHGDPLVCRHLSRMYPGAGTMTWLSGSQYKRKQGFLIHEKNNFSYAGQIQLHLNAVRIGKKLVFDLDEDFLSHAVGTAAAKGAELMVRPMEFDRDSLSYLLSLGISWFATDAPMQFSNILREITG